MVARWCRMVRHLAPSDQPQTPACSHRFHLLKPEYIYGRMKALQRAYRLRVLLCHVDTEDAVGPLGEVSAG